MDYIVKINRVVGLYIFTALTLLFVVYAVPPIWGFTFTTWSEFYQMLGRLIGIWGLIFGSGVVGYFLYRVINFLLVADRHRLVLRLNTVELILTGMFIMNLLGLCNGILRGEPWTYILGDTLKGSFIPLFYLWVKTSLTNRATIVAFTKLVLSVEISLFILFSATDLIPFAQSTRTFLYTVAFTLFFEEERPLLKILFATITAFALFIVVTTGAYRGTVIVFFVIVGLNFLLKYRKNISPLFYTGIAFTIMLFVVSMSVFQFDIEKNVDRVTSRFESTIQGKQKANYGLEESVFQRVGETIDVFKTFQNNHPIYWFVGFGNGAMLKNELITPSELSIYKSNIKHNIYITLLGVLFRQGLFGVLLYGMLFFYILSSIRSFYVHRRWLAPRRREYVYLKVLILYHFSVVMYSFVAYLFVGNIVIAFTLPLHILLRQMMEKDAMVARQEAAI